MPKPLSLQDPNIQRNCSPRRVETGSLPEQSRPHIQWTFAAAALWASLAWMAWHEQTGTWLTAAVSGQYVLTAWRLVRRNPARHTGGKPAVGLAWLSALLPLMLRLSDSTESIASQILQGAGLALALWALVTLGKAFGIAPADRGLIVNGPYRWIRHPAYLGELIALAGSVWTQPSLWNICIWLLVAAALLMRLTIEETVMAGYSGYASQVRWRLLPGVW